MSNWVPRRNERGMTIIELMISMVAMLLVVGAALMFIISQVRVNAATFERSAVQRGGRIALAIMGREIGRAGLGLPHYLAFQELKAAGDRCAQAPQLSVASLDYLREWRLVSATGDTTGGTLTLESASPEPTGVATDVDILAGQWLYLYQSTAYDSATPASGAHGHGMVHVGGKRTAGDTDVDIGSTTYGLKKLDLSSTTIVPTSPSRKTAVLLAQVSTFGVDCTDDPTKPYLFWATRGVGEERLPLAAVVDTSVLANDAPLVRALANERVGLRFRFLVDRDQNGEPDDLDGSGALDDDDWVPNASLAGNFPADLELVTAVEVQLRLRSERPDPRTGRYQVQDFLERMQTANIRTPLSHKYLFVDNTGL